MERIAPLAKILAEANGIDWQTIRGSGEGGTVVEQDILNYLSRIMSGEEEPPSTPVDVPPDDWNGDMNALPDLSGMSPEQLSRAGVDSDIAALLSQPQSPSPSQAHASPEVPATAATASLDAEDMEFELDDDTAGGLDRGPGAPVVAAATPAMGTWDWNASVPAADLAPVSMPAATNPAATSPELSGSVVPARETPPLQLPGVAATIGVAAASTAAASGLGSLLSRLYQQPPDQQPPAEVAPQDMAPTVPAGPEPLKQTQIEYPEPASPTHASPAHAEPSLAEGSAEAPTAHQSAAGGPAPMLEAPAQELSSTAQASTAQASTNRASTDEPSAQEPSSAQPATGEDALSAPAAAADAVWFGTYLRRRVDVGAVSALHGQLSRALGREMPLAFLVARAAQRHAAALSLSSVALHDSAGGRARSVAGEHLRGAVDSLAHTYEGTPDLLVVDAGALDLDDLHYPHTLTLSVGRVQDGHAALSLSGNVDAAQGARFLADLDATLSEPILLAL